VLGIHYRVIGMENLPRTPGVTCQASIGLGNLGLPGHFPAQVLVLKRELLWIPFSAGGLR